MGWFSVDTEEPVWINFPDTACRCGKWYCDQHIGPEDHGCPMTSETEEQREVEVFSSSGTDREEGESERSVPPTEVDSPTESDGFGTLSPAEVSMILEEPTPLRSLPVRTDEEDGPLVFHSSQEVSEDQDSMHQDEGEEEDDRYSIGGEDMRTLSPLSSRSAPTTPTDVHRGTWLDGIDSSIRQVIESMEPEMKPETFHGMFSDSVDVMAWALEAGVDPDTAAAIWVSTCDEGEYAAVRMAKDVPRVGTCATKSEASSAQRDIPSHENRVIPIALMGTTTEDIAVHGPAEMDLEKSRKSDAKLDAHRQFMYGLFLQAGQRGSRWMEVMDESEEQERRKIFLSKFGKFTDPATLGSKTAAWRRWKEWSDEQGIDAYNPRELKVAEYIRSRSKGGPTAAHGVYQSLLWLETYVGIRLHTESSNVIAVGEKKPKDMGQATKQAEIATPSIFLRFHAFCKARTERGEKGTVVILSMFMMAWMVACIRAKHAQSSWVTETSSRFIHFWCPEGKRRVQGVKMPFAWVIPRKMGIDVDIWPYINSVYDALRDSRDKNNQWEPIKYFIPDIQAPSWGEVTPTTPWKKRPMPYDKMSKIWRGMCLAIGVEESWACQMTTYTPRRFGPTCCGALGYNEEQMQALSNWQEVPEHKGKADARARFVMSRHYDGSTDLMSGDLKGVMVVAIHQAFEVKDLENAIQKSHLDAELRVLRKMRSGDGPTKLESMWMSPIWQTGEGGEEEEQVEMALTVKERSTPLEMQRVGGGSGMIEKGPSDTKKSSVSDESQEEDSDDSSSDTISSETSDGKDEDWQSLCWFVQAPGTPAHFARSEDPTTGAPIPLCRESSGTPFSRQPYLQGDFRRLQDVKGNTRGAHLGCIIKIPSDAPIHWRKNSGCND